MVQKSTSLNVNTTLFDKTFLGLFAASFAFFLGLLQIQLPLDTYLIISMYCFMITFPISFMFGFFIGFANPKKISMTDTEFWRITIILWIDAVINLTGVACMIMHFSLLAGLIFIVVCILTFLLFFCFFGNIFAPQ